MFETIRFDFLPSTVTVTHKSLHRFDHDDVRDALRRILNRATYKALVLDLITETTQQEEGVRVWTNMMTPKSRIHKPDGKKRIMGYMKKHLAIALDATFFVMSKKPLHRKDSFTNDMYKDEDVLYVYPRPKFKLEFTD